MPCARRLPIAVRRRFSCSNSYRTDPKTYQEREYILRLYVVPDLGHIKLKALNEVDPEIRTGS